MAELTKEPAASVPTWIEMESVIPLAGDSPVTVEKITSLSADTVKRRYPGLIVYPSERRVAMKLKHALEIASLK